MMTPPPPPGKKTSSQKPKLRFTIDELVGNGKSLEPGLLPPPSACDRLQAAAQHLPHGDRLKRSLSVPNSAMWTAMHLAVLPYSQEPSVTYPWFMERHSHLFSPSIFAAQAPSLSRPKRIRTAFSPAQLLELERAFDGNHYVVGGERRQLARRLRLTETQVKVWFQNRRTKRKRQKQDDQWGDPVVHKESNSWSSDEERKSCSLYTRAHS